MRRKLIGAMLAIALAGCISRTKLDAARARVCVSETFAFVEATRGIENPVRILVDGEDKDFIFVSVLEEAPDASRRLGTFRIGRDRRIWRQDLVSSDWRLIGICD